MCDGGSCQVHRGIIGLRNRLIRIGNRPLENGMVAAGRPKMQFVLDVLLVQKSAATGARFALTTAPI